MEEDADFLKTAQAFQLSMDKCDCDHVRGAHYVDGNKECFTAKCNCKGYKVKQEFHANLMFNRKGRKIKMNEHNCICCCKENNFPHKVYKGLFRYYDKKTKELIRERQALRCTTCNCEVGRV